MENSLTNQKFPSHEELSDLVHTRGGNATWNAVVGAPPTSSPQLFTIYDNEDPENIYQRFVEQFGFPESAKEKFHQLFMFTFGSIPMNNDLPKKTFLCSISEKSILMYPYA